LFPRRVVVVDDGIVVTKAPGQGRFFPCHRPPDKKRRLKGPLTTCPTVHRHRQVTMVAEEAPPHD
jgi:hypothetical protein